MGIKLKAQVHFLADNPHRFRFVYERRDDHRKFDKIACFHSLFALLKIHAVRKPNTHNRWTNCSLSIRLACISKASIIAAAFRTFANQTKNLFAGSWLWWLRLNRSLVVHTGYLKSTPKVIQFLKRPGERSNSTFSCLRDVRWKRVFRTAENFNLLPVGSLCEHIQTHTAWTSCAESKFRQQTETADNLDWRTNFFPDSAVNWPFPRCPVRQAKEARRICWSRSTDQIEKENAQNVFLMDAN